MMFPKDTCKFSDLTISGEIILEEKPLVFGPKASTTPLCLGCHKQLKPLEDDAGRLVYYKCTGNYKSLKSQYIKEDNVCLLAKCPDFKQNIIKSHLTQLN